MTQLSLINEFNQSASGAGDSLVSVVIPPLDGEYLYRYDHKLHPTLTAGSIIEVTLGRRLVRAFVLSTDSQREERALSEMSSQGVPIKSIPQETKVVQAFTAEHQEFLEWVAKYHAEPLSKILDLAVPAPAFEKADPEIKLADSNPSGRYGSLQQKIIDFLKDQRSWVRISEMRRVCEVSMSAIRALEAKGVIIQREHNPGGTEDPLVPSPRLEALSTEQRQVTNLMLAPVTNHTFASFLLHGVTGSGKTEVYLELIVEALRAGRSALVVVPEIALTPQLLDRFESRLRQEVAVLHSSLKPHQRWSHWRKALEGTTRVVIGARSAIFAPLRNLGLIVVDEEHDSSFKQSEGIRYNARDLAVVRAKLSSCPIVLGSATPSLESLHHAQTGKHTLVTLPSRFYSAKPLDFEMIDLNKLKPWEMPSRNISPRLLESLIQTVKSGEQAFVLYNRRGFATYLQCTSCEHVVGCPYCSVTLTYHQKNNSLLCHFCGYTTPPPSACANCGAKDPSALARTECEPLFKHRGSGTERVFEELSTLLPEARLAKLDRDAVRTIDDYTAVLRGMRAKEIDILVGTQMIAKGHDLPDVTLVGIVDCDVGLHVPDFRAGERAFQLLTQVAGRAGRREKQGRVVLQTRVPQHPSLQMTIAANYWGFAEQELQMRKLLGYPPYQRLLRIVIGADDTSLARRSAITLAERAAAACESLNITMLGPAAAPVEKIRNYWRFHLLFKAQSAAKLQNLMLRLKRDNGLGKNVRIAFDLDPQDML